MRPRDMKIVLDSMTVLVDSREQDTDRARWRYASIGLPVERCTLDYGDYSYNATLPDGRRIYDISGRVQPAVAVERKMNLDELAECFGSGRERFEREFQRARDHGASIYLLVEDANWENLIHGHYKTRFNPNAFEASLLAFMVRYDLKLIFCKKETSGKLIRDILYRELKERLERGDYG